MNEFSIIIKLLFLSLFIYLLSGRVQYLLISIIYTFIRFIIKYYSFYYYISINYTFIKVIIKYFS